MERKLEKPIARILSVVWVLLLSDLEIVGHGFILQRNVLLVADSLSKICDSFFFFLRRVKGNVRRLSVNLSVSLLVSLFLCLSVCLSLSLSLSRLDDDGSAGNCCPQCQ